MAGIETTRFTLKKSLFYFILIGAAVIFLLPIAITVTNSFMSPFEITTRYTRDATPGNSFIRSPLIHFVEMSFIPAWVTLKQYMVLLLERPAYLIMFWNSVKLTVPVVLGQILVAAPAAFVFEYSKFKWKENIFFVYIVIMLMPSQVTLVSNYIIADLFGIEESYLAIILPGIFNPFGVFLLRQFLKGIPYEYVEAAKIDGAGNINILFSITLPMIKSAVAALAILTFVEYWNIVDQAIVFIKQTRNEPLSVHLSSIISEDAGVIFAASCFYMLPTVLVFLYGQEYMIEGIQLSGIK